MLPNKSEKILSKFMQVILFALIASALSAFYISQTHAADVVPNEIQMPGTQHGEVDYLRSSNNFDNNKWQ